MPLPRDTEAVLHAAIEAAYTLHDETASSLQREAAAVIYAREQKEYLRLRSDQWWEQQCEDFPDCSQCRDYDC